MARSLDPRAHAAKRAEILDAAMGLVLRDGYERTTIRRILDELGISKGAFYHYFDSKVALLDAFVEQVDASTAPQLQAIVDDPELSAVDKLRSYFATFDQLRNDNLDAVLRLARVWYADVNALVRRKVDDAVRAQRAPVIAAIASQGVQQGVFTTPHPQQAGHLVISLVAGMADQHAVLLGQPARAPAEERAARIAAIHAATMDAVERVLGCPTGALFRVDAEAVMPWVRAAEEGRS